MYKNDMYSHQKKNYIHTVFYKSIYNVRELPKNKKLEIAFLGRSNSGKSSTINSILKKK